MSEIFGLITRQDILTHQAVVPWVAQYQVEQDLLLCRAMVALFDDKFLNRAMQLALVGFMQNPDRGLSENDHRVTRKIKPSTSVPFGNAI